MDRTRVEISIKTIFIILLTGIGLYIFTQVTDILTQIFIAFVLMTALNPVVTRLVRLRMSRPLAILTTYLLFIGLMVVAIAAIVPPFIDQTTKLFLQLRIPASPVLDQIQHLQFSAGEMWSLLTRYGGSLGQVFDIIISTFSVLFTFFTILVMSVYLLIGRDHLYSYFTLIFRTSDRKERSKKMLDRVEQALGSWVRGEFILMVSIGIMTYIGLLLLNIPYALPLAIFAGLMEALPNLGPTIAAIPAVIVAAVNVSPVMGGVTAILYMVIQQVENNFVVPQVMKRATGIRPLTTIVLILIGIRFAGIAGALLIVPLYIVIREVLLELSPEIQEVIKG